MENLFMQLYVKRKKTSQTNLEIYESNVKLSPCVRPLLLLHKLATLENNIFRTLLSLRNGHFQMIIRLREMEKHHRTLCRMLGAMFLQSLSSNFHLLQSVCQSHSGTVFIGGRESIKLNITQNIISTFKGWSNLNYFKY